MISELSFCIGRLEGYHQGLLITEQKPNGMDLLLKVATVISTNVDILEDWFKKEFPE
jgi:hypothetical protein